MTVKLTVPGPLRPVPLLNVRKLLALVAVQAQPGWVVTATVPVPAFAPTAVFAGLIE